MSGVTARRAWALSAMLALAACVTPATRKPEAPAPVEAVPASATASTPSQQLAALIAGAPDLSRFRALAAAGGLATMIAGRGQVTILAPTDAALARLAPATIEALLLPGNRPSLLHLLRFWIVPGALSHEALVAQAATGAPVPTLDGEPLHLAGDQRGTLAFVDADRRVAGTTGVTGATDGDLIRVDGIIGPQSIEPGGKHP